MAKKAKARQAAKKIAAKSKPKAAKAAKPAAGTPRAKLAQAVSKVASAVGAPSGVKSVSRSGYGFRKRKSAKSALKKAYEKRAFYLIRTNQLGQARKALRKKATVV